jgi:hypothetical protein
MGQKSGEPKKGRGAWSHGSRLKKVSNFPFLVPVRKKVRPNVFLILEDDLGWTDLSFPS